MICWYVRYTGDYERKGASNKVVKWFWEVPSPMSLFVYDSP